MINRSRMTLLNRAIDGNPQAAINYVLRGELWLKNEQPEAAIADFQAGIALAEAELENSDWDYLQQTIIDRAQQGLKMAQAFI